MNETLTRARQLATAQVQRVQLQMLPTVFEGAGCLFKLSSALKERGARCAMVVTTQGFVKRGSLGQFLNDLIAHGITSAVFADVVPDPDYECVERAAAFYRSHNCDAIIAIGGGSVIDCAKIAGALISRPGKTARDLIGTMKIHSATPLLAAVPTTAGTGSETTAAAVVTSPDDQRKHVISDLSLIPDIAVLDPTLLLSLPANLTAYSGMDALTHAVEAYINRFGAPQVRSYALDAVTTIFEHLKPSFDDGKELRHREAMLTASYWAGIAFTNAFVGYVHALSHAIGGRYHVQHGLANAVILPVVLEEYGPAAEKRLAELARAIGIGGQSDRELARDFIARIRALSASLDIPAAIPEIQEDDIASLAASADEEANPAYPVPEIWHYSRFQKVLRCVMSPLLDGSGIGNAGGASADSNDASRISGNEGEIESPLIGAGTNTDSAAAQVRIAKPGPLLDSAGRLTALGYATSQLLTYNRKQVKASPLRIKEWDYYLVHDEEFAIALTVGDMGYAALVSASLLDFCAKTFTTQSTMDILPLGRLGLPASSSSGITAYKDKRSSLAFESSCGLRRLTVTFDDFKDGDPLIAEIVLDREPRDSMVIATPWAEDASAFYYNQKIVGMRAIGSFELGSLRHYFQESTSLGLLDWGRGVWTHDNTWYWAAAQGYVDGRVIAFNLGYGFGDTSAASENMLFVDGVAHKLGRVDFGIPQKAAPAGLLGHKRAERPIGERFSLMSPWHFSDDEGRLDLVFEPEIDRFDVIDFKVVKSDQHQVFGHFSGSAVLDDGSTLEIWRLRGFAEAVHNKY